MYETRKIRLKFYVYLRHNNVYFFVLPIFVELLWYSWQTLESVNGLIAFRDYRHLNFYFLPFCFTQSLSIGGNFQGGRVTKPPLISLLRTIVTSYAIMPLAATATKKQCIYMTEKLYNHSQYTALIHSICKYLT